MTIHELNRLTWKPAEVQALQLAAGDVIKHRATDEATIYNLLRSVYPQAELLPIAPGTQLYSQTGAGCSYIKNL